MFLLLGGWYEEREGYWIGDSEAKVRAMFTRWREAWDFLRPGPFASNLRFPHDIVL
jgi:hypothetical protein